MANARYLAVISGIKQMIAAISASAGVGDAGKIICTDSTGKLDSTLMPAGVGVNALSMPCSAAISAGMMINVYNAAGVLTARPADSTTVGSEANGWAPSAISNGASGTINMGPGTATGLSSLTIGSNYFLGTNGAVVTTAPSTAGNIVQLVGKALSATTLAFDPDPTPITVV